MPPRTARPAAPSAPRRALALALALAAAAPERGAAQQQPGPGPAAGLWSGLLPAPGPGLAGAADNDSFLATQLAALEERRQATLATFDTVRDNLLGFLGAAPAGPSGGFLRFAPLAAPDPGPDPGTEPGQRFAVAEEAAGAEAEGPQPAGPVGAVCRTYAAEALTQFDSPSPGEVVSTIVVPDKGRLVAAPEVTVDVTHPLAGSARLTLAARWQRKAVRAVLKAFCTKKTGCPQEDARADIAGESAAAIPCGPYRTATPD